MISPKFSSIFCYIPKPNASITDGHTMNGFHHAQKTYYKEEKGELVAPPPSNIIQVPDADDELIIRHFHKAMDLEQIVVLPSNTPVKNCKTFKPTGSKEASHHEVSSIEESQLQLQPALDTVPKTARALAQELANSNIIGSITEFFRAKLHSLAYGSTHHTNINNIIKKIDPIANTLGNGNISEGLELFKKALVDYYNYQVVNIITKPHNKITSLEQMKEVSYWQVKQGLDYINQIEEALK